MAGFSSQEKSVGCADLRRRRGYDRGLPMRRIAAGRASVPLWGRWVSGPDVAGAQSTPHGHGGPRIHTCRVHGASAEEFPPGLSVTYGTAPARARAPGDGVEPGDRVDTDGCRRRCSCTLLLEMPEARGGTSPDGPDGPCDDHCELDVTGNRSRAQDSILPPRRSARHPGAPVAIWHPKRPFWLPYRDRKPRGPCWDRTDRDARGGGTRAD